MPSDKALKRLDALPIGVYAILANLFAQLGRKPYRVHPLGEGDLLVTVDHGVLEPRHIHICRRIRHRRYKKGVMAGVDGLARTYHLHKLPISTGGVFIDCGANVGELGLWARERGLAYEAFEPEPLEARCCDLNNFGGEAQTHRAALWNEATTLTFHSKPDTADSSVFEIDDATGARDVQAVRLDAVIDPATFGPGTRIFKLEGEGAEPEILQGAEGLLPHLDYIAADCGYERGRAAQHTFIEVNDFLLARGYRLIEAGFTRVTVVYRNEARFSQR